MLLFIVNCYYNYLYVKVPEISQFLRLFFFNLLINIFEKVKYLQANIYETNCSQFSFLSFVSQQIFCIIFYRVMFKNIKKIYNIENFPFL